MNNATMVFLIIAGAVLAIFIAYEIGFAHGIEFMGDEIIKKDKRRFKQDAQKTNDTKND